MSGSVRGGVGVAMWDRGSLDTHRGGCSSGTATVFFGESSSRFPRLGHGVV